VHENSYKILNEKLEVKRPRHRWKDNNKMDLKGTRVGI
jgi:hypothetical protein